MTFYDHNGSPIAYLDDDREHIYLFSGKPVAYLDGEDIYNFSGGHLGWLEDGWVRDSNGNCVFFTKYASSGPFKPFQKFEPFKGFKQFLPFKGFKQVAPMKPFYTMSWSKLSGNHFFR